MAALASDRLRHFRLLLWNRLAEFNEIWQEARSQHPLHLCVFFSGPIGKTRWPPWPLIGWDIFNFCPVIAERNSMKLDRKQDLNILYQVCVCVFFFCRSEKKTRWPPWPLIGWVVFDFSSQTAEQNSTILDRKQYINVLYKVCVFRVDRKHKMVDLASDWLRHFRILLRNRLTEFNQSW